MRRISFIALFVLLVLLAVLSGFAVTDKIGHARYCADVHGLDADIAGGARYCTGLQDGNTVYIKVDQDVLWTWIIEQRGQGK